MLIRDAAIKTGLYVTSLACVSQNGPKVHVPLQPDTNVHTCTRTETCVHSMCTHRPTCMQAHTPMGTCRGLYGAELLSLLTGILFWVPFLPLRTAPPYFLLLLISSLKRRSPTPLLPNRTSRCKDLPCRKACHSVPESGGQAGQQAGHFQLL